MGSSRFYWFVELIGMPPKYLMRYDRGTHNLGLPFKFTADPHCADKYNKEQAEVIAKEYREAGLNVEAREHGFIHQEKEADRG